MLVVSSLQFIRGRNAISGLRDLGLEGGGTSLNFGQPFASISLLDITFGYTVFLQTGERNLFFQQGRLGWLATGSALGDSLFGDTDLTGPPEDSVFQDGALASLSLQRLGNLGK